MPMPSPVREPAVPATFPALDIVLAVVLRIDPVIDGGRVKDDGRGERERE
jgi:hypothetical protein